MINDLTNLGTFVRISEEDHEPTPRPNEEHEYVHAKTFLQKGSTATGDNLYDHLTEVLNKILSERPENVVDFFEEYSRKVKEKRFKPLTDHLEDIYVPPGRYKMAKKLLPFLKALPPEAPSTVDPEDLDRPDMSKNNMMELLHYFEHVGVGLPRIEMFCLTMSMRQLTRVEPVTNIKFWGKIFGMNKNYLVLEAKLRDDVYAQRNEICNVPPFDEEKIEEAVPPTDLLDDIAKEVAGEGEPKKLWDSLPAIPKPTYESPPEPPSELSGVGLNQKVYYVCNEIGDPWIQLPDVTPQQIRVTRQIYRTFTGNLDQPIISYPVFPGTERNYLRAQIARISAGSHIAPLGYYTFGGDEMGEEEMDEEMGAGDKTEIKENLRYDPLPIKDLTDKSMMYWVHCAPYILNQGRTTWWNPNPLPDVMDEELGEEEEEAAAVAGPEPETGPQLLTACSEDVALGLISAWSVRSSSNITDDYAVAVVRSNYWPGAYCFATVGKTFQNVYFGNGLKFTVPNFSPLPLPPVQQEYPPGPEIMEIIDPTGAEEEAWRIAHLPKEKPPMLGGEEQIPEEEEEDEDDDEDDD